MKLLYLFPLMLLMVAGCKKDPTKVLPKATQEGKNTMGCLVDGKAWTPIEASALYGGSSPIFAQWSRQRTGGGNLRIAFTRSKDKETQSDISFFVPGPTQTGSIALNRTVDPYSRASNDAYGRYIFYSSLPYPDYRTGSDADGTFTLTRLDTVACIASGTFEFTARTASGQTVQVKEGRFDVRFTKR